MKQAESATKTAKTLMEAVCLFSFNNYMLILNQDVSSELFEKEKQELLKKLKRAETDRDAMKHQAKNLQEEYDRICTRLNKLEV